jgi:UDP-N-acetyl-D-glucosamine dehydrogenase
MSDSPTPSPSTSPSTVIDRLVSREARVAVVGQGYVGLTVAATAAEAGFWVTGIDVDAERVDRLSRGEACVPGVTPALFDAGIRSGRLQFSATPEPIADAEVVLICVPTPLRDHSPDLHFVEEAAADVAAHLRVGALVLLESTTYPGTTDDLVVPILEARGLRSGLDFLLAYSPERVDPGNQEYGMRNTPRVVGGHTPAATEAAVAFYEQIVDKVVQVSTTRAAETAKLLENTFRHINIGLVNELAMLCHELGIDVWEVIDAAGTKPFGFMPFAPGPGIGGHCIPLDPTYLSWQVRRQLGRRFGLLEQAQDVNERMPNYVVSRIGDMLNEQGRAVRGARILALGVAYKPDVGDVRGSPSLQVIQQLHRRGAEIGFHDFFVDAVMLNGEPTSGVQDLGSALEDADLVVLLTPHTRYDLEEIAARAPLVFDTRNAFGPLRPPNVVTL